MHQRILGSSSFPRVGEIGVLHLYVPRNLSTADDRFDEDTDVSKSDIDGKHNNDTIMLLYILL